MDTVVAISTPPLSFPARPTDVQARQRLVEEKVVEICRQTDRQQSNVKMQIIMKEKGNGKKRRGMVKRERESK